MDVVEMETELLVIFWTYAVHPLVVIVELPTEILYAVELGVPPVHVASTRMVPAEEK